MGEFSRFCARREEEGYEEGRVRLAGMIRRIQAALEEEEELDVELGTDTDMDGGAMSVSVPKPVTVPTSIPVSRGKDAPAEGAQDEGGKGAAPAPALEAVPSSGAGGLEGPETSSAPRNGTEGRPTALPRGKGRRHAIRSTIFRGLVRECRWHLQRVFEREFRFS